MVKKYRVTLEVNDDGKKESIYAELNDDNKFTYAVSDENNSMLYSLVGALTKNLGGTNCHKNRLKGYMIRDKEFGNNYHVDAFNIKRAIEDFNIWKPGQGIDEVMLCQQHSKGRFNRYYVKMKELPAFYLLAPSKEKAMEQLLEGFDEEEIGYVAEASVREFKQKQSWKITMQFKSGELFTHYWSGDTMQEACDKCLAGREGEVEIIAVSRKEDAVSNI